MNEAFAALENGGFAVWVRESPSMFAYTGLLALHAMGLAFAVGCAWFIALRVLGFARGLPLASLDSLFSVMWIGFWVNAASGVPLLLANATRDLSSPVFLTKIAMIALAGFTMVLLRREVRAQLSAETDSRGGKGRLLGGTAALLWAAAIVAGRLSEYPELFGLPTH
jgi:hypothetical protein